MSAILENCKTVNDIDVYVGHRVRCIRMALGMTQKELADKIGISFQQLQKNEKGDNKISCSRLHILSLVLGVKIGYFFEGLPTNISNYNLSSFSDDEVMLSSEDSNDYKADLWDLSDENPGQMILDNKDVIKLVKYYNKLNNSDLKKAVISFLKLCKNCN